MSIRKITTLSMHLQLAASRGHYRYVASVLRRFSTRTTAERKAAKRAHLAAKRARRITRANA